MPPKKHEAAGQGRVNDILKSFELSDTDIQVYIFLAKKGPQREQELKNTLNLDRQKIHSSLWTLKRKSLITVTSEQYACFSATPFEKVLDMLTKLKIEEAVGIQQQKENLLQKTTTTSSAD